MQSQAMVTTPVMQSQAAVTTPNIFTVMQSQTSQALVTTFKTSNAKLGNGNKQHQLKQYANLGSDKNTNSNAKLGNDNYTN